MHKRNYNNWVILLCISIFFSCNSPKEQIEVEIKGNKLPIMGWSSWNHFRVNIDEKMIREQADAMVETGMFEAGYQYINIDDGFFGGRNDKGELIVHPIKFPSGMRNLSDYIHSKGLKAGIYSEAGISTCAAFWDNDTIGVSSGLFGNEERDLRLMLREWNYDFIKVDWCGAEKMGLDEEMRYSQLINLAKNIRPDVIFNICRWQFPGTWAPVIADSWRISADINNNFSSILNIIDLNADLWKYCSPGHFNDMDMLQVGRGMSYEEDKAHFTMWCMMNSPLLVGNDLRDMSKETLAILTNHDMIALNQDPLCYQARKLNDYGDLEVWAKPLISTTSGQVAVTLLNRSNESKNMSFSLDSIGLASQKGYTYKDLWSKKDYATSTDKELSFTVPSHGVMVLKIKGTSHPYNIFQQQ